MINSVYLSKSFKGIASKRRKRIAEHCLEFKLKDCAQIKCGHLYSGYQLVKSLSSTASGSAISIAAQL